MGRIGTAELIIILVVLLLLFGARRIPEIARAIGQALSQFKKGLRDPEAGTDENSGANKENEG